MKPNLVLSFAIATLLAAGVGWLVGRRSTTSGASSGTGGPRIQFYQDSMHPWIKSDQPGKCTICGMDLTPVREGEQGLEGGEGLITLRESNITVADVRTVPVERRSIRKTLRLAGAIAAADERRIFISARASGEIVKLFQENLLGRVQENTPLAVLSSNAVTELERQYIALVRGDNLEQMPGGEMERTRSLALARTRLEEFGFRKEQIDALPERTDLDTGMEIRTPIAGTVVNRQVYVGMAVTEGHRMFEVIDFSKVWFKFDGYEADMAWLAPNLDLEVSTPSAPGKTFAATITYLEPSIGHMVRSIKGRAELENPLVTENGRERRLLLERAFAEGVVTVEVMGELAIPRTAVLSPGSEPLVYVEKGKGTYERRPVILGRAGDEMVEVLGGLAEGESIVTRGNLLIDAQAQINQIGSPVMPAAPTESDVSLTKVTEDQQFKASGMFGIAVSMASALARDNVDQFNQQVVALENALLPFEQAFADYPELKDRLSDFEKTSHLEPAADLPAARKKFLSFSNALVKVAKAFRQIEAFGYVRIYHCPMVDDAVPGGPKDGFWIQAAAPLRNPFFGPAMLGCGVEVNPPEAMKEAMKAEVPQPQTAPVP